MKMKKLKSTSLYPFTYEAEQERNMQYGKSKTYAEYIKFELENEK